MRHPLTPLLAALIAGILAGEYANPPRLVLLLFALVPLFALPWCLRRRHIQGSVLLICITVAASGALHHQRNPDVFKDQNHVVHLIGKGKVAVEGFVLDRRYKDTGTAVLTMRCLRIFADQRYRSLSGDIRLSVQSGAGFQEGDYIRFIGAIREISTFQNPGGFDYARHLARKGIYASAQASSPADIVLIRRVPSNDLFGVIRAVRQQARETIVERSETPSRDILLAMALGESSAISPRVRDVFAATGAAHILAVSGLHVGIVWSCAFFLLLWILKRSEYLMLRWPVSKIAALGALLPVVLYAFITGMQTPVLRAMIAAAALVVALIAGRARHALNTLFLAALIILTIRPQALFEVSFQLSFAAVFSILYLVPRFQAYLPHPDDRSVGFRHRLLGRLSLFFLVSAAAMIGTMPILAYYFNRVSVVALLSNIIAVPLLGFATLGLMLIFLATSWLCPALAGGLIEAASFIAGWCFTLLEKLSYLPCSSVSIVRPNAAEIVIFYLIVWLFAKWIGSMSEEGKTLSRNRKRLIRWSFAACLVLLIADIGYWSVRPRLSKEMSITAIDVGQGASTLIEFPGGFNMLIDGGGFHDSSFDMGRFVIAPFLYAKRIRKIDVVVLTHPHPDHLQGLIYITRHFDVGQIWSNGMKSSDELYASWEKIISDQSIEHKIVSSGSLPVEIGKAVIFFLGPDPGFGDSGLPPSHDEENDASVVMRIVFGQTAFLLPGDISSKVEARLVASVGDLKSDILLAPHHGSRYSSSQGFVQRVAGRLAIISCGNNNIFRHPHPEVLDRYEKHGYAIFRTDLNGAVRLRVSDEAIIGIDCFRQAASACASP